MFATKKIVTAAALLVAAAGAAHAADLPARVAPAPYVAPLPVFTWTGAYFGINAGAAFDNREKFTTDNNTTILGGGRSFSDSGFSAGGQIGYNYQLNGFGGGLAEVAETFGDLQGGGPGGAGLTGAPDGKHQRPAECGTELHTLTFGFVGAVRAERLQGAFDLSAALPEERQLDPQRHRGDGQRNADRRVAGVGERPVEGGPDVVDVAVVGGQPVGLGQRFGGGFRGGEDAQDVAHVAAAGGRYATICVD